MITGTVEFTQTLFNEFVLQEEKRGHIIPIMSSLVSENGAQMTHSVQYYLIE